MTADNLPVTRADIDRAADQLAGAVLATPLIDSPAISEMTGVALKLKLENLQYAGSFKARGAYVRMTDLSPEEKQRGVIAMSAGNHAQGVAFHAQRMGIPATIVMPVGTPFAKVERTASYGARVVMDGETLAECRGKMEELKAKDGLTLIHPYDDPRIIAGQGSIGLEMLESDPDLEVLVVPIGGGGMMSGIAVAAKSIKPGIELIGVQSALYPAMVQALAGDPIQCGGQTLAEGIAVKVPGELTKEIIRTLVDDIILVSETQIERAVMALIESQRIVAEGAGAAGLAAVMAQPERFTGRKVGVVICGGNIDSRLLSGVLMRGLVRDRRLVRMRIQIADQPGILGQIAGIFGKSGGNIVEIYHHRLFHDVPAKLAELDVVAETRNAEHVRQISEGLTAAGFQHRLFSGALTDGDSFI